MTNTGSTDAKLPLAPPLSRLNIETIALDLVRDRVPQLLTEPGAFPVIDFVEYELYQLHGYRTWSSELTLGVEAVTIPQQKTLYLREDVYEALTEDQGRARFTATHEEGHVWLHRGLRTYSRRGEQLGLFRKAEIPAFRDPEWQANQFAAAVLMPAPAVRVLVAREGTNPGALAETFKVSAAAARIRLQTLEELRWL